MKTEHSPVHDAPLPQALTSLHIMVADDDPVMRNLLGNFLRNEGHTVVLVTNGTEALEVFTRDPDFDLFILDIRMPGRDGLSVCAELKRRLTHWVPIMMVSGNSEERSQVEGLDIGADYYLTKPVSFALLRAYVRAAQRAVSLQHELQEKNHRLERWYNRNRSDNDLARQLLDCLFHSSDALSLESKYVVDRAGEFSGDLIISLRSPSHRVYSMVADATGHGLPAAITLIPAVETFSRLAREGYTVETIARELNARLRSSLPRERFVAAIIMMFEPHTQRLEIWNGACPPVYLLENTNARIIRKFPAMHPPLGILEDARFDARIAGAAYRPEHTVVACTDGVVETENSRGELYGTHRLETLLESPERPRDFVTALGQALRVFSESEDTSDDRSLLVLPLHIIAPEREEPAYEESAVDHHWDLTESPDWSGNTTGGWYMAIGVNGDVLGEIELGPVVNSLISRMGVRGEDADRAHVCITELLNNAIDHGVLGLDSSMKAEPEGFEAYFEERQKRIRALTKGGVFVRANLDRMGRDYSLAVTVSDSGAGFYTDEGQAGSSSGLAAPSGRGIRLVRRLSDRLQFHDHGATAEFRITGQVKTE